jgi:hypothetical protein
VFSDAYWARLEEIVKQAVNRSLDERMSVVVQAMEYAMTVNESRLRDGDDEASLSSQKDNVQCDALEPRSVSEDDTRDGRVDDVASAMTESDKGASGGRGPRGASLNESSDNEEASEDPVLVVTRSSSPRTKCASQRPPSSPVNEDPPATACASASQVSKTYTSAKVLFPYLGRVFDEKTTS